MYASIDIYGLTQTLSEKNNYNNHFSKYEKKRSDNVTASSVFIIDKNSLMVKTYLMLQWNQWIYEKYWILGVTQGSQ